MCTLTYRLTETGYEIFFNRDEQRSRTQAMPPQINENLDAIYPIDPIGKGTWLAVHHSGLSLALLNYYHATPKNIGEKTKDNFVSRGDIILTLLKNAKNPIQALKLMKLSCYQPFQICIFESDLTSFNQHLRCFQWDGELLAELHPSLPITSSGVDYLQVYQARKLTFQNMVEADSPTSEELVNYHHSQQHDGKLSVKMSRLDAQTVSFSRISVNNNIEFEYVDYLDGKQSLSTMQRTQKLKTYY